MSKKDKKRQTHNAHVQELHSEMSQNRDVHFRTQIVALTNEGSLIQNADAYELKPLDESVEEVHRKLEALAANTPYQSEVPAHAGRYYSDFAREVDQVKEEREIDITLLRNSYDSSLNQLKREADYKLKIMDEEYKLMYKTLRDRLMNSLNSKINTLIREKEQLDIADTNSLLLHPTQFSITNPTSPGGTHTSRKTRLTRQRVDGDDHSNNHLLEAVNRRKRKAIDDDPGSPAQDGSSTPAERAKARLLGQQTTPSYTVNSLFTDKELHMHSFNAHLAVSYYFTHFKRNGMKPNHNSRRGSTSSSEDSSSSTSSSQDIENLSAPEMDRTASSQTTFHVTRSTRTNAGALLGINLLADHLPGDKHSSSSAFNGTSSKPTLPYALLANYNSKNGQTVPQIAGLTSEEVDDDLTKIEAMSGDPTAVDEKLMEELCSDPNSAGQGSRGTLAPEWPAYLDGHLEEAGVRNHEAVEGEG
ncbi:MAG: hypothetical protein Q9160_002689 [Pyrenula sp. 1 TL-2023]